MKDIITLKSNVPKNFAEAVKKLHTEYNVKINEFKEYKNDWITVIVKGNMDDLISLNKACSGIAYKHLELHPDYCDD